MKNISVLIVDDDPTFVLFVRRVLETLSYRPAHSAGNPDEALAMLADGRFDVVLLDIELGSASDGFELYETILSEFDVPVIFVTARPEESVAPRIDPASVHGLLFKPIRPTELDVAISTAVRNRDAEVALREKHADLENVVWHATDPVLVVNEESVIELASGAFLDWIEEEGPNVRGRNASEFLPGWRLDRQGGSSTADLRIGSERTVGVEVHNYPLKGGRFELLIPRIETQEEQKLTIISRVFDTMVEGVFILDGHRRFVYANLSFLKMLDYKRHEIEGRNVSKIASRRYGPRFAAGIWSVLKRSGRWEGSVFLATRNGSERNDWLNLTAMRQEGRIAHVVGLVLDATERKRHEEMLFFMAHHDYLTGLPNRSFFQEHLERSLLKARRSDRKGAVFFVDLDGFKGINDSLGHQAGDETLRVVARRLREILRKTDIVGRYGGDEFTILIDDLNDYEHSLRVADKIVQALNCEIMLKDRNVQIGASVGISLFPKEGVKPDELMQLADAAMYLAKRSGGSAYRFSDRDMERIAVSWRRYRAELEREARTRKLQFRLVREATTNEIYALQPELMPGHDEGSERGLPGLISDLPSVWMEGYWRFLAFLRDEAGAGWLGQLADLCIFLRTPAAALVSGEALHELVAELQRLRCRPVLEVSEGELEKLLEFNSPVLDRFTDEGIRFAIREATGVLVRIPQYMRLPVECFVLSTGDVEGEGEDRRLLISVAQSNARLLGLRVLFDDVSDAETLESLGAGESDVYRGPLAGHLLSAADVQSLLKK